MSWSVGQVAGFAGVTVRTLHHYDEIGLLTPIGRSHAGHRRYEHSDLDRLQQILFYRELGFPLDEVATLLDDPDTDPREHLRRQHGLLSARITQLQQMAAAVETAMEAQKMGINLSPEEKFEVFGDHDPEEYAQEAGRRWGDSAAYAESQRRSARYTKDDWQRYKQESADWNRRVTALMESGAPADGEAAMDLAEEHRAQIVRWFYDCDYAIHTGLAELYVTDDRFTQHYEQIRPNLARYLHDAILANAGRAGHARPSDA